MKTLKILEGPCGFDLWMFGVIKVFDFVLVLKDGKGYLCRKIRIEKIRWTKNSRHLFFSGEIVETKEKVECKWYNPNPFPILEEKHGMLRVRKRRCP